MGGRKFQKLNIFMDVAVKIGQLGTCDRKQVGAVIVRDGRCISWGFNGAPEGLPHCDENWHGWGVRNHEEGKIDLVELIPGWQEAAGLAGEEFRHMPWDFNGGVEWLARNRGCRNATHAEANALAFAARQGISTDHAHLFVGVSPCETCARLLIAAGIWHVFYKEEYRKDDGIKLLVEANVDCTLLA